MLNDKFFSVDRIVFMSFADSKYAPMLKRIKTEALNSHFFLWYEPLVKKILRRITRRNIRSVSNCEDLVIGCGNPIW